MKRRDFLRMLGLGSTAALLSTHRAVAQTNESVYLLGGYNPDAKAARLSGIMDRINSVPPPAKLLSGLATGFSELDELTSGLQPSDLIVIAGRPSLGKTVLAMNIAVNAGVESNLPVAIFSMDIPGSQLTRRMLASLSHIDLYKLHKGNQTDDDWMRLTAAERLLKKAPIYIDDTPSLTPFDLRTRARSLTREHEHELSLIIVDNLQLMQSGEFNKNRAKKISVITCSLKSLARELDVPVIVLSQTNRNLELRLNNRPIISDLDEWVVIEQQADNMFFIYRDEIYTEDSPDRGIAEIIIRKQRNGPTGTVRLLFKGEYAKFESVPIPRSIAGTIIK